MSKSMAKQNLTLIQTLHTDNDFLKRMKVQWLEEISNKAHFFVFGNGTILAQEREEIDYLGIILEGRAVVSGKSDKQGSGFTIGQLGYFGLLDRHASSIIGESDGIVLAIRFEEVGQYSDELGKAIVEYAAEKCIAALAKRQQLEQVQQIEEKKIAHLYLPALKNLLNEQIQPKQKASLLKYFPFKSYKSKDMIIKKQSSPTALIVIRGEIIAKGENSHTVIKTGQLYNSEGFMLNYSKNQNIFCLSEEAVVMMLPRALFLKHMRLQTYMKFVNYFLRNEINAQCYEIESYEKKKQKQDKGKQDKSKWSVFDKNYYEILPLNMPARKSSKKQGKSRHKQTKSVFMGSLFQEQLAQKSNIKTSSSNNSKISKIISLKTEKNEDNEEISAQKQVKSLQKDLDGLALKVKYYEENYLKAKLDAVHYHSRLNMQAVLKQINEIGDHRHKGQIGVEDTHVTTLKHAFQKQMKENRIKQVVARCAYKWLWAVRRKKGLKNVAK